MSDAGSTRPDALSRRALLGRVGAAGAFVALTDVLPPAAGTADAQTARTPAREPLETLTPAEAATLESMTARLIPSDTTSPGATEARAAHYIDRALGGALAGFRGAYGAGLASVDAYARASKGALFAQLSAADQDAVLGDLERNAATGFEGGSAGFFALVLSHTMQGTFSDPFYGGNRNFAGWDLIGYPGVRLAATAEQQNLDAKPAPTRMSAYDYSMFSRRKPSRAGAGVKHDTHGD
ncbi:MAG TPA: gluconate 2-dehydrogenase subunit 3 family protein [Vicinamibacterales bacterium]|nr:gluconate 2-dehydrogenase subunit 3 family protein [Vicinamibacterales bacterium]